MWQRALSVGGGGKKVYDSTGTPSSSRIECGFRPRIIMVYDSGYNGNTVRLSVYYNADISASTYNYQYNGTAYSNKSLASDQQIYNIDDTGFYMPYYANYSANAQIVATE